MKERPTWGDAAAELAWWLVLISLAVAFLVRVVPVLR
jgi:hypothetical protein